MIPIGHRLALKLVIGIGCLLLVALLIHDRNRWKAKTTHYAQLLAGERAAHSATEANYRAAADRARRQAAENAARVKSEQGAINQRSRDEFQTRIAAARALAERLRPNPHAASTNPGDFRTSPVPGLSAAAGRTAQAAGEDRLPDADRLTATEQAIQLEALIAWVRQQAEVRVNEGGD
jgi:hypothetical protein